MKQKNVSTNQITEGVIWKQLLLFFFPIMLGTLFQQLYNTADAVVVGRFVGTQALAAVGGSTGQIVNLVVNFFVGLASGATVIIARYYGAKKEKDLNDTLHTAAALSIVGGILISIIGIALTPFMMELLKTPADVIGDSIVYMRIYFAGIIFVFIYNIGSAILRAVGDSPFMMELLKTPADVIGDSIVYMRIYFAGIIFVFIYNIGSAILRAVGDSTRPLYFLIVCCFINIFLDILLVVGMDMGVAGAAIATVASQAVSAVLVIRALLKSKDMYRLEPSQIRFHKFLLVSIITIGLPAGLQSIMYNASNMIVQSSLNSLGTSTMAAYTAFGKIDAIYWMISGAFSVAITTFIGQNFGAGKYKRMKQSITTCLFLDFAATILVTAVLLFSGKFHLPVSGLCSHHSGNCCLAVFRKVPAPAFYH